MKNRGRFKLCLVQQLQMPILALMIAFGMTAGAVGTSTGLDSFCGFTAGEMRNDRKIGDLEQIETKPKKRFRKFERVGLKYSQKGRLCEICSVEKVQGSKPAAGKKAKKEFEECIKWFQHAGVVKATLEENQ